MCSITHASQYTSDNRPVVVGVEGNVSLCVGWFPVNRGQ